MMPVGLVFVLPSPPASIDIFSLCSHLEFLLLTFFFFLRLSFLIKTLVMLAESRPNGFLPTQ